ncbi:Hint domain-containing protein [Shimia sp. R9_1]|uniref:Hint domain-containing protein n=1 Tax=Shimia sp. R9_1 TaxID=2821111 RepID=UPI001ADB61D0|nr:Hint domain-containing protein [Shimia sp. R9_1]MBO9406972.1 Hint domain-containing protein [Shimia sp. R9_1]
MAPKNLIINGTFDAGASGWSGSDIEANHRETAYLHNGSQNAVSELDGRRGLTTVLEQSFEVSHGTDTELTFDSALRNASNRNAGKEGFNVEILDADNKVIASMEVRPTANELLEFSLPVSFPKGGTYTLRFTERGPNDSLGAIVDNISLMVCFAGGTRIATANGTKAARDIEIGDVVRTETGLKPVRWVGRRQLTAEELAQDEKLHPVRIAAGALGQGLPKRDLFVSRQHRMAVHSPICQRMFGQKTALVAAIRLCGLPGISLHRPTSDVDYVHLLFDQHEVVFAEGCPSESLLFGKMTECALSREAVAEIKAIFPETRDAAFDAKSAYVIPENPRQKQLVRRLQKNHRAVLEGYAPSLGRADPQGLVTAA